VIHAALPHLHRRRHVADLLIEIANLVEQNQLVVQLRLTVEAIDDLDVRFDGLVDLILDLEVSGFFLRLGDVQG
jgi:hypothetical protein